MREVGQEVIPPYMIGSKETVLERANATWTKKKGVPQVTESYHTFMTNVRIIII